MKKLKSAFSTEKLSRDQMKNIKGGVSPVDTCAVLGKISCTCGGHTSCVSDSKECLLLCA